MEGAPAFPEKEPFPAAGGLSPWAPPAPLAVTVFQAPLGSLVRVPYVLNKDDFADKCSQNGTPDYDALVRMKPLKSI